MPEELTAETIAEGHRIAKHVAEAVFPDAIGVIDCKAMAIGKWIIVPVAVCLPPLQREPLRVSITDDNKRGPV